MSTPLVQLRGVSKVFDGTPPTTAVDNVTLDVGRGEIFGIIGSSGAGKSTLVRLINGLERVTSGTVQVAEAQISELSESGLRAARTGIGMIFQQFNLFRSRTVRGNIEYPLRVAGWPRERRRERVDELLGFVGLRDQAKRYPEQLSGGQKQRVGIARALATNPELLLADEATSALDPETTNEVLRLLKQVNAELGVTVIVITHEMDVVRSICDRVAVMQHGRLVEVGDVFDVFSRPQSETAKSFVSTVLRNRPDASEISRLHREYPGTLINVGQRSGVGLGTVLGQAAALEVTFDVIHGGIQQLQDQPFGSLTLQLQGEPQQVQTLIDRIAARTDVEVL